eukprot:6268391-Karenia_brevis.AAC.1
MSKTSAALVDPVVQENLNANLQSAPSFAFFLRDNGPLPALDAALRERTKFALKMYRLMYGSRA